MNGPLVRIRFDGNGRMYRPGETFSGEYRIESVSPDEVRAIEVSVLWYTEGKGDQDSRLVSTVELANPGENEVRPFNIRLPEGPFSFSGKLISLVWALEAVAAPGSGARRLEITVSPTGKEILLSHAGAG
jgi:hypothetical protein